ncbi:uncharacterized protein HaLaN_29443 [Haematococcus lacustris]|uniref:RRM domain-containing protein n=1 Tax=Haematococcus lacustris TaxID=44745 RepID=A0A6A0AE06_HAELA|nr:uncharacterized protein HaLaN_29443 [Haematococcus lacustris]
MQLSLTSDLQLRNVMEVYGPLLYVSLARHQSGLPKGFAFVEFKRSHHAEEALFSLNGQ